MFKRQLIEISNEFEMMCAVVQLFGTLTCTPGSSAPFSVSHMSNQFCPDSVFLLELSNCSYFLSPSI